MSLNLPLLVSLSVKAQDKELLSLLPSTARPCLSGACLAVRTRPSAGTSTARSMSCTPDMHCYFLHAVMLSITMLSPEEGPQDDK